MRTYFIINCVFIYNVLTNISVYSFKVDSEKILSFSFIKSINRKQKDWKAGRNFFKESELKNLINVSSFGRKYYLNTKEIEIVDNITEKFDSRKNWPNCSSIAKIKSQGNCASSYAIVPASIFTDRLCIQKNVHRYSSSDQLLSCCKKCGGGCFGGFAEKSFIYMRDVGLITGGDYGSNEGCRPYRINKCPLKNNQPFCGRIRHITPSCYYMKCTNPRYKVAKYYEDKLRIKTVYSVPSNISSIKSEIVKNGPVSALMTIYEDFFNYKSGVYHHTNGVDLGKYVVKLIGWGKTDRSKPYWLAINSWGKTWGENGVFKILLGVNECDIESVILAGSF